MLNSETEIKVYTTAKSSVFRLNFSLIKLQVFHSIVSLLFVFVLSVAGSHRDCISGSCPYMLIQLNLTFLSPAYATVCFHPIFDPADQCASLQSTSFLNV